MIGLESCFPAVNKILVQSNKFKIERLIDLLTVNPRRIMKFNSNLFKRDCEAEITVIDPGLKWTFSKNDIYSRSINSPFIGENLYGKIKYTISKGILAEV